MRILIGAPVCRREWIVDRWARAAARSAEHAGVDYGFVLLGGADDPTFDVVDGELADLHIGRITVDEPRTEDVRDWNERRFPRMVELRNLLLDYVRVDAPDLFLSLDSDVILHRDTISHLIETLQSSGWDAVGGFCHLSEDRRSEGSYANLPAPSVLHRPPLDGMVQRCDVLMAIKLMTPLAYWVGYEMHAKGEDIGWSVAMTPASSTVTSTVAHFSTLSIHG
jgi:hypothetical protein